MRRLPVVALGVLVSVLSACGGDDPAGGGGARQVEIRMTDNAYTPDSVQVERGERVTFVFTNEGEVDHEAFVGTAAEQAEREEALSGGDMGGMDHDMSDMGDGVGDDALELAPGESGELTYTFEEGGEYLIACHEPGHYEDGMRLTVEIT